MQPSIAKDRPPYITFMKMPVEDRDASQKAGHVVYKDIDYVVITPSGSRDRIERVASEWFDKIKQDVREGRCPGAWLTEFEQAYKMWKEGQEIPLNGTSLVTWPVATPAEIKTLLAINVRTVEDLAAANAETLQRIGMGAMTLKQRATDWLKNAEGPGKLNAEMAALRADKEALLTVVKSQNERLAVLEARLGSANPAVSEAATEKAIG